MMCNQTACVGCWGSRCKQVPRLSEPLHHSLLVKLKTPGGSTKRCKNSLVPPDNAIQPRDS